MPEIFDSEDIKVKKKSKTPHEEKPVKKLEKPIADEDNRGARDGHGHRHVDEYSQIMKGEQPTGNNFSWYMPKPTKLAFNAQDKDEHIILVLRQHPITQLKWMALTIVLAFMPLLFVSTGIFNFLPFRFYFAGFIAWYLLIGGYLIEAILKWFYNVYIITDERIVDVDFYSLLQRNISSAKIDKIEDVTASTTGFFAAIFDYGNVVIQTAGEKREFEFPGVPSPNKVATLINELIIEEEQEKIEGRVR